MASLARHAGDGFRVLAVRPVTVYVVMMLPGVKEVGVVGITGEKSGEGA